MTGKSPPVGSRDRPVIKIEPRQLHAGVHLLAVMTWPYTPDRQMEVVVTMASMMLGQMSGDAGFTKAKTAMFKHADKFARQNGIPVDRLMADPIVLTSLDKDARELLDDAYSSVLHSLFEPAGGHSAVARATGFSAVIDDIRRTTSQAKHVGRAMCIMASMDKFHPELNASLNRAWAVMEADANAGHYAAPGDRARFMRMWGDWQSMGPLHAALRLYLSISVERGAPRSVGEKALSTPEGVEILLGWAKWFRGWAVGFIPKRAREPLISDAVAATFETSAPTLAPPIEPLRPAQVAAAAAYKAPTNKFT